MFKKIMVVMLTAVLGLSLAGCGNSTDTTGNANKENSSVSGNTSTAPENSTEPNSSTKELAAQLVGRWEQGYLTNSDEPSFEQYNSIVIFNGNKNIRNYMEFYSNGTGCTVGNYSGGTYYNSGVVFKWKVEYSDIYKKNVLTIYYAAKKDECDEFGFQTKEDKIIGLELKDAKVVGIQGEGHGPVENYDSPIETVSLKLINHYQPCVKVGEFTDNVDMGCEDAFKSIDLCMQDPDAYEERFKKD